LTHVARELSDREDTIEKMKKISAREKKANKKDKQKLQKELNKQKELYNVLEEEYTCFKKELEASPISLIKNEVNKKNIEI